MGYKVLYRKYRPTDFNELVGQKPIKDALVNAIIKNQLAHAYIFTGPRGTGKTSMAKIFAKALTCLNLENGICCNKCNNCLSFNDNPDIIEIDAASNNGVDEIREIRNNVKLVPTMSKYKIYIIDEVHMLSNSAWNAFLKTLEEPPSHVIFIFATTEINKVPITVLSRCQRFDFQKIKNNDIDLHIRNIADKENFTITDDAINEIIKLSDGCLRDALSYLDQLSKVSTTIDLQLVSNTFGVVSQNFINDLLTSINNNDIITFLDIYNEIVFNGVDFNSLINNLIDFLLEEAIKIKKREKLNFNFDFCYKLINDLINLQKGIKLVDNPYNALEIILLNYIDSDTNIKVKELQKKEKNNYEYFNKKEDKIISREIIKKDNIDRKNISREIISNKNLEKLKQIRINNVFCGANKDLKKEFVVKWKQFVEKISDLNNYSLLGYIENVTVEVVSDNVVLFSTKLSSDSVIFNSNVFLIESELSNIMNIDYKVIALDNEEWKKEKENYIKNKNIERIIISEDILKEDNNQIDKTLEDAQNIFGNIIEIN